MLLIKPYAFLIICPFLFWTCAPNKEKEESKNESYTEEYEDKLEYSIDTSVTEMEIKNSEFTRSLLHFYPKQTFGNSENNYLYCTVTGYMWESFMETCGGKITTTTQNKLVNSLNSDTFYQHTLSPATFITYAGDFEKGRSYIIKENQRRFYRKPTNIPSQGGTLIYSYLYKSFKFDEAFNSYNKRLKFKGKYVQAFGLDSVTHDNHSMTEMIDILYYKDENEFIVRLNGDDAIILAKIPKLSDFSKMYAYVMDKMARGRAEKNKNIYKYILNLDDRLLIPKLNLDLCQPIDDLLGVQVTNRNMAPIDYAMAMCQFSLNEKGVELQVEEAAADSAYYIEKHPEIPQKKMIFDQPFLIMMMEYGRMKPYFMIWTANDELMKNPD
jgi:hypothetical protein